MKFLLGVSLSLVLLQKHQADAFLLPSTCPTGRTLYLETSTFIGNRHQQVIHQRSSLIPRFAGSDDDDEEDEYDDDAEEGPLAKGIDSVSWLPSVEGAKGDNTPIESTKQVR
ncbi:MAG: hypothetical protein ACI8RD_014620 [Bacillariaceae sp.]|jgi:hypothetical protein